MNFIKRFISHHIKAKITEENIDENAKKRCHQYLEENNSALNSRSVNATLVGNNASLDTVTNNSEGLNNVLVGNNASLDTVTNNSEGLNNVTDDIKENANLSEVSKGNDFDVPNVNDFETTEAQNNSFEADCFDNIIDFSQMTSDASLNNIILDNLSDSAEIEEDINGPILECPENQVNDVIHPEDNTDNNIILDDFEKLLDEEIEKREIKDIIEKLVLVTENDCNNSLNIQQDDKTKEGDQTIYFVEIEGNFSIDNISNNQKVVDDITISSEEDLNLLSDLEIISISSQEESTKNDFTDNVNTETESDLKSNNCTEKKIDDTLQTNEINVDNINDDKIIWSIDENSCSSYHSSDFEFITEEEALKVCLTNTDKKLNGTLKTVQISEDSGFNDSESSSQNSAGPSYQSDLGREITDYRNAVALHQNYNFNMRDVTDRSYRRNHIVPEGDGYLNLFQGIHSPTVPYMMENKSTRSPSVYVQCEGIGFDMRAVGRARNSDDEFAEEAEESTKVIMTMYPAENKRKRRRF